MELGIVHRPGRVEITLTPGTQGAAPASRARLARRTATFEVDAELGAVHPDLLVLSALLCARPWVGTRTEITSSVAASPALAEALRTGPRLRLRSVSPDVQPRPRPGGDGRDGDGDGGGVPGLCFSGGTDSVAALAMMPERTRSYHLLRRAPVDERRATMFDTRAAEQSCARVRATGRAVVVVPSDVEYLRDPTGFPHDFTTAVPLLLHADADRLDAVAWGAPLEATYRLQRGIFRDLADSPFLREWGAVFDAVGLPVLLPVAGVSEVVTSTIVARHELGSAAQSCVRGPRLGRPCGRCAKCARKTLLAGAVTGSWPDDHVLQRQWRGVEPRQHLLADPIKVEPVVSHCVHRYLADGGADPLLRLVVAKTGPDPLPWLTRSYPPALEHLPAPYRQEVQQRLLTVAEPMTAEQEQAVRDYAVPGPEDPSRAAAQRELEAWLAAHPSHDRMARSVSRVRRVLRAGVRRWGPRTWAIRGPGSNTGSG
ncbi:DUF6395 domain-containing protein [Ornithinimicrobium sp. LYQ92]|uniref:DUF6395 domain-containing protein n=1 Tax=Serinicoccus sp. LYQ92 TaxID=3378798 RepID=UPI0038539C23